MTLTDVIGPGRRLLLIVGLQKSGTTLLSRMLQQIDGVENPFKKEGDDFWGNKPPFVPSAFPAGEIYQRSGGALGHEIGADLATDAVREELLRRLASLEFRGPVILNKNPFNTVRVPWLRALFPQSYIVAVVRRPVPNVFSLTKKYVPHEKRGRAPVDGWWGVKPPGWMNMVGDDKVRQCALQWREVNTRLVRDRALIDEFVFYHELCEGPAGVVAGIVRGATHRDLDAEPGFPQILCYDREYRRGSRLRSKNRYFRERGGLTTPREEPMEIGPLNQEEIETIEEICAATWARMECLR